jgi:hypothetical protein
MAHRPKARLLMKAKFPSSPTLLFIPPLKQIVPSLVGGTPGLWKIFQNPGVLPYEQDYICELPLIKQSRYPHFAICEPT